MPKPTVALSKCTWHHRVGTGLVGSDSGLRETDADHRHPWGGAVVGHRKGDGSASLPDPALQDDRTAGTPSFKAPCLEQGQTQASAEILAASFLREPCFQDSQLHLWCSSKGLSPEDPKIIRERRAAFGLL